MTVVKMLVSLAAANFSYAPGDKILVNDEVAEEWIRIGHAEAYEEQPVKLADLGTDSKPEVVTVEAGEEVVPLEIAAPEPDAKPKNGGKEGGGK